MRARKTHWLMGTALSLGLLLGGTTAVARADEPIPPHGHMLVLGVESGTYQKCIDLAAGQELPLNTHHEHLHTGAAGEALFTHAGHFAFPTAPVSPFRDCAHLAEVVGPPTK